MITPGLITTAKAGYILATIMACTPHKAPMVEMVFKNAGPEFFNDKSSAELGRVKVDTTYSHSKSEVFTTGGLTRGYSGARYEIGYTYETEPNGLQSCLAVDSVKITISYTPEIYIASEHKKGTCDYDQTLQHEMRHLNTDLITINEYLPAFKKTAQKVVDKHTVSGPFASTAVKSKQQELQDMIAKEVSSTMHEMDVIRLQRQQLIDTRQEYLRLSRACKR